ncbi:unnamed protein product, partial [Rotaria sordida]
LTSTEIQFISMKHSTASAQLK